ncbi:hypothetical protein SAMN04488107_1727 [Geodermatophilus saharensis]|uniref:Uncharacterized protein n=1 Tax=Geodermatophilus saharensis TaxID=1137994 RepID=A0A239CP12_9ACTN|nr:hypothetical protein [Geodermatophilus saharensis]SNS21478.1 hypothetical protein SAMN04488107_1727 [Geodermatophilus saharensis]
MQGRRLQEAAGRPRERAVTLAEVAADQPHLTRDVAARCGEP